MIKVKRNRDGKIFDTDMFKNESIYEIHFCTSYTTVCVQEEKDGKPFAKSEIYVKPVGTSMNALDSIAFDGDEDWGEFV